MADVVFAATISVCLEGRVKERVTDFTMDTQFRRSPLGRSEGSYQHSRVKTSKTKHISNCSETI